MCGVVVHQFSVAVVGGDDYLATDFQHGFHALRDTTIKCFYRFHCSVKEAGMADHPVIRADRVALHMPAAVEHLHRLGEPER